MAPITNRNSLAWNLVKRKRGQSNCQCNNQDSKRDIGVSIPKDKVSFAADAVGMITKLQALLASDSLHYGFI